MLFTTIIINIISQTTTNYKNFFLRNLHFFSIFKRDFLPTGVFQGLLSKPVLDNVGKNFCLKTDLPWSDLCQILRVISRENFINHRFDS